jgi:preprotein translocase subunit Sec61beta
MDQLSAREKARQAALSRSKATKQGPGKAEAQQGRANPQGNQLTFFGEDTAGWKISPTKVMLICLFYIGAVVVLHIFAKVKSGGSSAASEPKPEM